VPPVWGQAWGSLANHLDAELRQKMTLLVARLQ